MSRPPEQYACIYIREFPAQALLRLRTDLKDSACVVMDGEAPFEQVCSLNTKAKLLGIQPGMSRTDVDGFPEVKILTRSLTIESTAREILLECADMYSPRIEESSSSTYLLFVIDIAGTKYLFGPPETLASRLLQDVRSHGFSARVIVSSNFHTAVCLAKGYISCTIAVIHSGEEAAALSALPLKVLPLTQQQTELFGLWGIKNLGMLAALPDTDLIARLGQHARYLQQIARGELQHLFQPIEACFTLEERQELDFPIESLDSLIFGIAIMLDQLLSRARLRLVSLAAITLILELEGGTTHTRRVRPAHPGNDKQFWLRLLHLDLQTQPPQAAVFAVRLHAEPGHTSTIQLGLNSSPLPEPSRLDVTLAQLKVILGEENVGCPTLTDSHRSESYTVTPFTIASDMPVPSIALRRRSSARQLHPPAQISINLDNCRPGSFALFQQRFVVEHTYGPWTAGGEWWNETSWKIEQWDVVARSASGSVLYCCIGHDLIRNIWHIKALYD